jgi:prepilin-type N-terminal cleavage/methylation domain-containing protein
LCLSSQNRVCNREKLRLVKRNLLQFQFPFNQAIKISPGNADKKLKLKMNVRFDLTEENRAGANMHSANKSKLLRNSQGFSLIEITIVLAVAMIVASFALPLIDGSLHGAAGDAALTRVVEQLRLGRDLATAQRRNVQVLFSNDNEIELVRMDVPNGTTSLSAKKLEGAIEFCLFDDLPDTPDGFGNDSAVDFGGADSMFFLSDGTLADAHGDPVSGTVFIGEADHPETARAVTILGATGRVRGYRWTGESWIH